MYNFILKINLNMNEKEDFLSENISSINDKELKKELLENQSFNNFKKNFNN